MKYKYLQVTNFPFFFELVNIDTNSKQIQLRIPPIVTSYICHRHDTTMRLNKVNVPIPKSMNILDMQNNNQQLNFPNNHLLSWSFPGGTRCKTFLSRFEIGMSSRFGFPTPSCATCAHLGRQNSTSSKDVTSMCVNLILMKIGHTFGTWGFPFIESQTSPTTINPYHQGKTVFTYTLPLYLLQVWTTYTTQGLGCKIDILLFWPHIHALFTRWLNNSHVNLHLSLHVEDLLVACGLKNIWGFPTMAA